SLIHSLPAANVRGEKRPICLRLVTHALHRPAAGSPIATNSMPQTQTHLQRQRFFDFLPAEFAQLAESWGWPAFRARQVCDWVYVKSTTDVAAMTNLRKIDRQFLAGQIEFDTATVVRQQTATDGTIKVLISWQDGKNAESVMIPDADRRTACLSSQVGCPVGCRFCASGVNGSQGNLSPGQIVEQVFALNRIIGPQGERINHIVLMGMGEPLANYANTVKALRILHDPLAFNIGARKMTLSTVGVPARIRELADEGLPINLALSLHAPSEPLRRELIPWAEHFALDDILEAARYYFDKTGREITLEYILLSGVNDRPEHARQLARLCKTIRANVNLIRYNQVEGLPYQRPLSEDVVAFQQVLRNAGVNAHVRKSRGRDIDAACGQLRRREQELPSIDISPAEKERGS
ncbi:MAG: 23S rRNA (adenine(2503)-C(2))-methyltransferase RlmN, partial [Tepidisphaerales bacterium]